MKAGSTWAAVANPARRRLIELLRDGPRTTGDLCEAFVTTRFATMKHLDVLVRAGIVTVRREGRERWNVLDPEPLRELEGRWPGLLPAERRAAVTPAPEAPATARAAPAAPGSGRDHVVTEAFIDAPPWRVFDALTQHVAAWWGGPHLRAADATNLVIEPQPGGRLIEEWGHRQGTLRAVVTAIKQDEHLELAGTVVGVAQGVLALGLERREGGTVVRAEWTPGESVADDGTAGKRALDDLLKARLKAFVEDGTRTGVAR